MVSAAGANISACGTGVHTGRGVTRRVTASTPARHRLMLTWALRTAPLSRARRAGGPTPEGLGSRGHDGRLLTLEDTVEFFNLILETRLSEEEKQDLVAFLKCL